MKTARMPSLLIWSIILATSEAEASDSVETPSGAMKIHVLAQQFTWSFKYPEGMKADSTAANTLFVPVGKSVELVINSKDVIHDWWVPELGQKVDAIPGRTTTTWFKADEEGTYEGQCAEFCGSGHATMTITVKVLSQEKFTQMMETT